MFRDYPFHIISDKYPFYGTCLFGKFLNVFYENMHLKLQPPARIQKFICNTPTKMNIIRKELEEIKRMTSDGIKMMTFLTSEHLQPYNDLDCRDTVHPSYQKTGHLIGLPSYSTNCFIHGNNVDVGKISPSTLATIFIQSA